MREACEALGGLEMPLEVNSTVKLPHMEDKHYGPGKLDGVWGAEPPQLIGVRIEMSFSDAVCFVLDAVCCMRYAVLYAVYCMLF